jgi:hypothetical protein
METLGYFVNLEFGIWNRFQTIDAKNETALILLTDHLSILGGFCHA